MTKGQVKDYDACTPTSTYGLKKTVLKREGRMRGYHKRGKPATKGKGKGIKEVGQVEGEMTVGGSRHDLSR